MLPFRKILFPVDYSEPCRAVVPYVKEIAHRFSAEVTLVHAYPPILLPYGDLAVDPVLPEDILGYELARMKAFALEMFPGQHGRRSRNRARPAPLSIASCNTREPIW